MIYNENLYWRRIKNLYKAWQTAEDPDFKRLWMDKLQALMQQVDKATFIWYNRNKNIFYLDHDPRIAARYDCDKHVVKMILETVQMLSTAHRVVDKNDDDIL